MNNIAVFPGSFDPLTRGHEAIVIRALSLFDQIVVAIGDNPDKRCFFPLEKRLNWLKEVFSAYPGVKADTYSGLTVEYCKSIGARYIIRGLRTSADFDFEQCITQINKQLQPDIETVFLLSASEHTPLTSSIVRDIIRNGGDPAPFIPIGLRLQ